MPECNTGKLDKVIFKLIKGTIFLLPLFFLPWTSEYFEFSKQLLLWIIMPMAALLSFWKMAMQGRLSIKTNPLNFPILIFLSLTAVAAILSLDRFSSFFGFFGRSSDSWFVLLSFVILYFLIINTQIADSTRKIIELLKLYIYSSIIVASISLFSMLGGQETVFGGIFGISLPAWPDSAGSSLEALAIYLAVSLVLLANFLINIDLKKFELFFFSIGLVISLLVLAFVNFFPSWLLLGAGGVLIVFFRLILRDFKKIVNHNLLIPIILILLSVFFLTWPKVNLANLVLDRNLPREILLPYRHSFAVAVETVKKYPALGSGPGTWALDFSLSRPAELNQSIFWQIRFNKSGSYLLEMLATSGLLTALSYLLVVSLLIYINLILFRKSFKADREFLISEDYNLITGLCATMILLFFSQLLYATNTILLFIFWLNLALVVSFWKNRNQILFKEKTADLKKTALFRLLSFFALIILSAGWIVLAVFEIRIFAADIISVRAKNRQANLKAAIILSPYRVNYRISLAKLFLSQAKAEALKPIEERNNLFIQSSIAQAIETGRQAATMAPNSVLAQETMGLIYRDSRPLALGTEAWSINFFNKAVMLEPTNPVLATELAKAYFNHNDLADAEKYFNKALGLKGDYYEAKFGLVKVYLSAKKDNQALVLLEGLADDVKTAEIYYELGRLYYNRGEIDKAISEFSSAINYSPEHSNSLYGLAVAYEAQGNIKEALAYLEKVSKLNPENEEASRKIEVLKKRK